MPKLYLTIWWHQHQPLYKDMQTGEYPMPWVRLHGVRDYYGMARLLQDHPQMRATINLVPSLLWQIEDYVEHSAQDRDFALSAKPAADLSDGERVQMLRTFFAVNPQRAIKPYPRYAELFQKTRGKRKQLEKVASAFTEAELRDLQVWWNLVWMHPLTVQEDESLTALFAKERDFSEEEKRYLLDSQITVLGRIIPLHKQLWERGQIELTTTPFYHPILPLLREPQSAREAMPGARLPRRATPLIEDAREHIVRAVEYHAQKFGSKPRGMWPAEGSVSEQIIPLLVEHGIKWIGTDEEILEQSVGEAMERDKLGNLKKPELLYTPYNFGGETGDLSILFRDHNLSDLIGFHYQYAEPDQAVEDFVGRLRQIAKGKSQVPLLVTIIMDGENAWDQYERAGYPFLTRLYDRIVSCREIEPITPAQFLKRFPKRPKLKRLFPGSWISHSFGVWIGSEEDNRAWDYLYDARRFLRDRADHKDEAALKRAWEQLYAAEGSDWFWWYGDDHRCPEAALFDELFRSHLRNIYVLLGEAAPDFLSYPICSETGALQVVLPRSFIRVTLDGRVTNFFEWLNAGRCHMKKRTTMAQTTARLMRELQFGFDEANLFLRIDGDDRMRRLLHDDDVFRVRCSNAAEQTINVMDVLSDRSVLQFFPRGEPVAGAGAKADDIVELCIPFAALAARPGDKLSFYVELVRSGMPVDRLPHIGGITIAVPTSDFERITWQV